MTVDKKDKDYCMPPSVLQPDSLPVAAGDDGNCNYNEYQTIATPTTVTATTAVGFCGFNTDVKKYCSGRKGNKQYQESLGKFKKVATKAVDSKKCSANSLSAGMVPTFKKSFGCHEMIMSKKDWQEFTVKS